MNLKMHLDMKKYVKILGAALLASAAFYSCTDLLDEQPRSIMVPSYFDTEAGALGGIAAAYSETRPFYASEGPLGATIVGTDEATVGGSGGGGTRNLDEYSDGTVSFITATSGASPMWSGSVFGSINTLNGVLERGTPLGISSAILAEAYFLRAFYYFTLVRNYGGVPLDMGSGPLAFNTQPAVTSVRNSVDEVYTVIFDDLDKAIADLPNVATANRPTAVTKAAAYHFRSKAYLTYAWLLENANTFTKDVNKPLGAIQGGTISVQQAFQKAYDDAKYLIDNAATFGRALAPYFEDLHVLEGEYGSETLFLSDRTDKSPYSETDSGGNTGGKTSMLAMNICGYYENYGFTDPDNKARPMKRDMNNGRPWRRITPTHETITITYADKTNDSRYDATFQKVWYANKTAADYAGMAGEAGRPVNPGDTVWYMPGYDEWTPADAGYTNPNYLPNYRVWLPRQMQRDMYPTVKKWIDPEGHITANPTGNGTSRPFTIAKLSETYLILAEAALKLNKSNDEIRGYILTLRERAALRRSNTPEQNEAAVAAVRAATPATIDLIYIMMERSRELWGEFHRWNDLQRTRLLTSPEIPGLNSYHIVNVAGDPATLDERKNKPMDEFFRKVLPYHYLRPIPQGQFDSMAEESRPGYQNEGYD